MLLWMKHVPVCDMSRMQALKDEQMVYNPVETAKEIAPG